MRLLAVDLGDKRTGLATGDTTTTTCFPLEVLHIQRGDALIKAVANASREQGADAIVLGLPINMDGTEGPRAVLTREFGACVAEATDLPVHYIDERLTSYEAEHRLRGQRHGPESDALAALILLEEFMSGMADS
ncbi:MAG: Holliday junction resolvase RuvX [Phycisphaerales bacterium]|nr:Holliday junction resolvase RuvX [Phycisphaerales bacterium]